MFITKKISKATVITVGISLLLILFFIIRAASCSSVQDTAVASIGVYSLKAEDNAQRIAFLEQFGWQVESDPVEMTDILIPQSFNETYQNYNAIQLEQGLDLTKYKGKSCRRVSYAVTNYPKTQEDVHQSVRANLLIYEGKVIGGDICSTQLDGFMHWFEKPQAQP